MDGDDLYSITDYDDIRRFFKAYDVYIGHNITLWDAPTIERLLDIKIEGQLVDTLGLSWYLYPERGSHGLESWGEELGVKKPEILDWKGLSSAEQEIMEFYENS